VVPAPHAVLGTEPFAVIENFANATAEQIKEHVRAVLGANNALGGVVALKQLGLVEFPFNATHKVVKTDVQAAVIKYLKSASLKSEKA
jgi:4-coumarate--CoA ligase